MKKVLAVLVLIGLAVWLTACGGGSKKPNSFVFGNQNSPVSQQTSQKENPTKNTANGLGVSGKGCPSSITKVTSKDLGQAFVNAICSTLKNGTAYGPDDKSAYGGGNFQFGIIGFKPEGSLRFASVTTGSGSVGSVATVNSEINFHDCSDCPRDFKVMAVMELNPLGEWQLQENYRITFIETAASIKTKALRDVKIEVLSREFTLKTGDSSFDPKVKVQGNPAAVILLCQLEDGRSVEVIGSYSKVGLNDPDSWGAAKGDLDGTKMKIVAYAFIKNQIRTDWVYLDK